MLCNIRVDKGSALERQLKMAEAIFTNLDIARKNLEEDSVIICRNSLIGDMNDAEKTFTIMFVAATNKKAELDLLSVMGLCNQTRQELTAREVDLEYLKELEEMKLEKIQSVIINADEYESENTLLFELETIIATSLSYLERWTDEAIGRTGDDYRKRAAAIINDGNFKTDDKKKSLINNIIAEAIDATQDINDLTICESVRTRKAFYEILNTHNKYTRGNEIDDFFEISEEEEQDLKHELERRVNKVLDQYREAEEWKEKYCS